LWTVGYSTGLGKGMEMSLDYVLTDIDDWEELEADPYQNMVTQACVFSCLFIDMNGITRENWKDFYIRVYIWEHAHAAYLHNSEGEEVYLTADDVFSRIGLRTNVANRPESFFVQKVFDGMKGRASWSLTKETEQ